MDNRIDWVIEQAVMDKKSVVGCTVLVSQNNQLIYQAVAGFADRERQRTMKIDAIYRLSSVTKPFTLVATLALANCAQC